MESHKQIEDEAAALLAKRDSGHWTALDQARLDEWINASTARRIAVLRLESVWDEARRLRALSAGLRPGNVPPPGAWKRSPFFDSQSSLTAGEQLPQSRTLPVDLPPSESELRSVQDATPTLSHSTAVLLHNNSQAPRSGWKGLRRSIAATVLLAVVGTLYLWFSAVSGGDRYTTPIGTIASISLRDGSSVTLNTATEVRVQLTAQVRYIRLDHGEAYFDVAHDPNRPFVVQVGHKRIIAVGTKFAVRRNGENVRVVVTEGKVRVESVDASHVAKGDGKFGQVFVTPGSIANAADVGILVEKKELSSVEDDLSWRRGYLTFHNTPLADVVQEFNRYNAHKLTIEDSQLAALRISGTFRAVNYEAFVRVLNDGFAIHAVNAGDTTTLTK